jgi:predicted TPR repeat methyltransferase
MTPFTTSSGDLLADRRADYAEMLFADGEPKAAAEVMAGALEVAPGWALGWFRLGEFHETAGSMAEAVAAWRMAAALDPQDHAGAALKLVLAGAAEQDDAPPSAFVETLFDQYADRFDASLVGALEYRAPELLAEMLHDVAPRRRFARAVDLGCGTGLMGERLRPICDDLEGHDISAEMLRKAKAKGVYDRLVKSDLQTLTLKRGGFDLVTAADVFMYVGALGPVFAMAAAALMPRGLFAFSVESLPGAQDFRLRETRRYAHSPSYVGRTLAAVGLTALATKDVILRRDRGEPVGGLLVVAQS